MGASIGVTVGVNGESEYVRSLKNISAETRAFQSELREVQSAFDSSNDLGGQWSRASGILTNEIDAQRSKISKLKDDLDAAKVKYGENSTEVYRLEAQLNNAGTALHAMERQLANGNIPMLERAASETKLWQSELSKVKSGFTDKTSEWTKSQSTASALSGSISSQEREIKLLEDQVQRVGAAFGENSKECNEWKIKLNQATAELNRMKNELDGLPNRVESLGKEWEKSGEHLSKVGKSVSGVGDTLSKISIPVATGLGAAVKTVSDFEAEMDKAWSVTGALDKSLTDLEKQDAFERLSQKARDMGEATKFTAGEAANAIYYMGLAGWDTESVLAGLDGVMNLSAASGEDLARTSDIVTDSLTAFGQSAEMSDHFADVLAATMSNSNTTVDMLGESFKYVGAVAGSFGYSIDDIALGLGLMANAGVKASQAGTGLRQALQKITDPTEKTAAVMEEYGISLFDTEGKALSFGEVVQNLRGKFGGVNVDIQEMAKVLEDDGEEALDGYVNSLQLTMTDQEKLTSIVQLFGTRALPAVLAMIDASEEDYNKLAAAIAGASDEIEVNGQKFKGAAAAMAAIQLDNFSGQVTILKSKLAELAISAGEQTLPTLMKLVDGSQRFVDGLNQLDDGTKEMIIKVGLFVAAAGPVLSIGGRIISGIGTLISGGGKLIQLIGGIPSAISAITSAGGGLMSFGGALIGGIGKLAAAAAPFLAGGAVVLGVVAGITALIFAGYQIVKHWDEIKEAASKLRDWVSEKFEGLKEACSKAWEGIKSITAKGWDAAKKTWNDSMSEIRNAYDKHGGGLVGLAAAAMEGIHQAHEFGLNLINNLTGGKLGEIKALWDNMFHNLIDSALTWGKDILHNLGEGIQSGIGFAKEKVGNVAQAIKDFLGFSEPSDGPLSDFHTYAPDMMSLFASGIGENVGTVTGELEYLGTRMNGIFDAFKRDGWNTGSDTASNIGGGFESNMHRITDAAGNMGNSIRSSFASIVNSARSWGADLAGNMADGIHSAMHRAADAAASLASKLSSYLHFSEPDIGPLSNFHTWMPDMMNQLAAGIYGNMGAVDKAMNDLAMHMVISAPEMTLPERGAGNTTTITNGDTVINVYGAEGQDVRELAKIVEQEIAFNSNRRSVVFA